MYIVTVLLWWSGSVMKLKMVSFKITFCYHRIPFSGNPSHFHCGAKVGIPLLTPTWPLPHRYRHAPWPVDVTKLFPWVCCWTLIWLSRHWAWLRRAYWCYKSLIDWLIEIIPTVVPFISAAQIGLSHVLYHLVIKITLSNPQYTYRCLKIMTSHCSVFPGMWLPAPKWTIQCLLLIQMGKCVWLI